MDLSSTAYLIIQIASGTSYNANNSGSTIPGIFIKSKISSAAARAPRVLCLPFYTPAHPKPSPTGNGHPLSSLCSIDPR